MFNRIKSIIAPVEVFEDHVHGKAPDNYVVFSEISDRGIYGSGRAIAREVNCTIDVLEDRNNKKQLAKEIETKLELNNINYLKLNLGYLPEINKTQVTFDFYLLKEE